MGRGPDVFGPVFDDNAEAGAADADLGVARRPRSAGECGAIPFCDQGITVFDAEEIIASTAGIQRLDGQAGVEVAELAGGEFKVSIQGEISVCRERAHDRRRAAVVQHLQEEISRIVLERNPRVRRVVIG